MWCINISLRKISGLFILFGSCLIFISLGAGRASAVTGDTTNEFPNNGSPITPWAVVTRPGSNGMDSPNSTIKVYVPVAASTTSSVNVSFTIKDACDNTTNDEGYPNSNETYFWFDKNYVTNVTTSSPGTTVFAPSPFIPSSYLVRCDSNVDSVISLTVIDSTLAGAPSNMSTINGQYYRKFDIVAASHPESRTYYGNRFKYIFNGNVKTSYLSQPGSSGNSGDYTGLAYDKNNPGGWGWSTRLNFALKCGAPNSGAVGVYFFDTDHQASGAAASPYWQDSAHPMKYDIEIYDRETGAYAGAVRNANNLADQLIGKILTGGQNTPETTATFTMDARYIYSIRVYNINYINSIQVALPAPALQIYTADRCGPPVGFVDSCELVGNTVVLKGWAYDDNSTTSNEAQVRLSVSGQPDQTVPSNIDYRSADINGFLDSNRYGNGARDNRYGFSASYTGLFKGTNYTLSGTVVNVGTGVDKPIGIRQELSRPDLAGYGFPSNIIPSECLPNRPPPLACDVSPISVAVGEEFYLKVTLTNSNASSVDLSGGANYTLSFGGITKETGTGKPYDTSNNTYLNFPRSLPPGGSILIWSEVRVPALTVSSPGLYDVKWDVTIAPGVSANGDCGVVNAGAVDATSKPYVRFYGNDVIAGGDYGDCTVTNTSDARGFGVFSPSRNHAGYKGSSSELAVFASGQIDGVLPGSQDTSRSSLMALSFANTSEGLGSLPFGGQFGSSLCIDDYWADKPADSELTLLPTVADPIASNPAATKVDLVALDSGEYVYNGEVHLYADSLIPVGKRITIYVQGNTVIGSTSASSYDYKVAYNTAGWGDISQIPLIKIVTLGNIYIDDNVSQFDGMLVAVADPDSVLLGEPSGEIHTCAQFGAGLNLVYPTQKTASIASGCAHKLEVNGAFVAKKIKLLRTSGNILSAATAPEPYSSANIAEVFRFSPELYLAMLSSEGNKIKGKFDSVLSLPPAL